MPLWARVSWRRFLADGALPDRQPPATSVECSWSPSAGIFRESLLWKRGVVCRSQSPLLLVVLLLIMFLLVVLPSARAGNSSIHRPSWNSTRVDCRSGSLLLAARFWIELTRY